MNSPASIGRRLGRILAVCLVFAVAAPLFAANSITYEGKDGPGKGKHIVLVAGDEEYRSEEGLPMLGKLLSQRHGFTCTVVFSVDPDGTINPNNGDSISDATQLDKADGIIILTRFRHWPDADMKHFVDALHRGVPVIGLRTATHAFSIKGGDYKSYSGFGRDVLGETWVSHWGSHKHEATKGIIEGSATSDPIMNGVADIFGTTDVYEAHPPADSKVLVRGQVLKGMNPTDAPADYKKKNKDKIEQGVNDPMMPIVWTRIHKNENGKENRCFCTTMGAASDLVNEGLRRLVVNAVYWGLGMDVPAKADVTYVDDYKPTMYGFNGYRRGIKIEDHELGKVLREGDPIPPKAEKKKEKASATLEMSMTVVSAGEEKVAPLQLKADDHIAILGGAFADRIQFDGYLESLIHARFPAEKLVFRNLSASGDEVSTWHRSAEFGSRDEWLAKVKADVIFGFYGYNESFAGPEGVAAFKIELEKFIKATLAANYSGKGAPRLVLFSPTLDERNQDGNFPDPAKVNANIELYSAAMAEVAKANHVEFVDLLTPSKEVFGKAAAAKKSLTVNGHLVTAEGNKELAPAIFRGIFDETAPSRDIEKVRAAVNEKNWQWHQRYRTIDGYNVYGGRSHIAYAQGNTGKKITNNQVMQEEMTQRDAMTANRDKVVWAAVAGQDIKPDDSNLPAVTPIQTNKVGPNADTTWPYLSGEEAIKQMTLAKGCKVNLFADEKQFPELIKPLQMAWDTKGRLWVSVWRNYPERTPDSKVGDSILIFEDTKHTGHADKVTHFIDDLNAPTGFQFYKDGILLMQAPDVWYVRCTDGTDHANSIERVLMGMDSADSHHTTNAMCHDPGGAIYLSDGVFHRTQVETSAGPVRNEDGCIYRFFPTNGEFERYAPYGYANPHGRVFDYWGNDIITDATGNASYFGPAISGHIDTGKHPGINQFWKRPSRPCPGTGMLTSKAFPAEYQGNFLNCNVIGFRGIYRVNMLEDGSGLKGESLEDLVSSSDENFRPSFVNVGPDGAVYFADWSNTIIGHLQHHLRDPNRDHVHGRIYRVTYEGHALETPVKIDGQPIPALLELLKDSNNQTRELAKVELDKHPAAEVIAGVKAWIPTLNKSDPAYEHHMMEALWVHQWVNVVDVELLTRMLKSPEPKARAAAVRVLGYWRSRVPNALALLKPASEDDNARVRLEAVRVASFFNDVEAANVALGILKKPTDYYLDYVLGETMKQLGPLVKAALAANKSIADDNPAGLRYVLGSSKTEDMLKLPHTEALLMSVLIRPDLPDANRVSVLNELAEKKKTTGVGVLIGGINTVSADPGDAILARLLTMQPVDQLKANRPKLVEFTRSLVPAIRQAALASIATADQDEAAAMTLVPNTPTGTIDFLSSIPMVFDPDIRFKAYDKIKSLLAPELPADLVKQLASGNAVNGRYVRIELPHKGTLTLAEVQVMSGGHNVALKKHASQSSNLPKNGGGDASKAVDGNTSGSFSAGGMSHTKENDNNPWWQVDLGKDFPIDNVVVWNRTEGSGKYGQRLDGYSLVVLDSNKKEVFRKDKNPAPTESAALTVTPDEAGAVRDAAIRAATSLQKQQADTFGALATLVEKNDHVISAARGIRALPRQVWVKARAGTLADALLAWATKLPADARSSTEYVETIQFAGDLAGLLPAEQAASLRSQLKALRVSIFVVRTVREQMRYDTTRLVVEAGKPFEIILENGDFMPHNLAVVMPKSREALAAKAATMKPDSFDSEGRAFIPKSNDILAASKLIEPGQRQTLKLVAPSKEGDYEYFCTYPGHWELMWGKLVVTKDVDAYLQSHADAGTAGQGTAMAAHHHHH